VTEATTLTITNCPCTITKPVTTQTYAAPTYANTTAPAPTKSVTKVGTISATGTSGPTTLATAGAGKAAALSGGALAGVLGLAAFIL